MKLQNINVKDIFNSLSTALDFTYTGLSSHHKRVAFMAVKLADQMGLDVETKKKIFLAAIIHDIGAMSMYEKELLWDLEIKDPYPHSDFGFQMIKDIKFLIPVSNIIMSHHDCWKGNNPSGLSGREIPLESRIILAVDRLDVLINHDQYILHQTDSIMSRLKGLSGSLIDPCIYEELVYLTESECFWLDLVSDYLPHLLHQIVDDFYISFDFNMVFDISRLFAKVIDHKSIFTHKHSRLVAASARLLAEVHGFSRDDTEKLVVAGLLHDLGKLSIPEEILEKPGKLTPGEFLIIKRHTYYTHRILEGISGFEEINRWASFHHEKIDGTGYPFRLKEESIPMGARFMAVSDVFAALAEDRPYRRGMPREQITNILNDMSGSALDSQAVKSLKENYDLFEGLLKPEDPLGLY
ncbi:MAG: HD-GYP domain-containing protein [Desulfocucumaceae bacterium]